MDNLLEIQNLTVELMSTRGIVYALSGIDLNIKAGEIHGVVGESGSGKSMTAKSILKLHNQERSRMNGKINFDGKEIISLKTKEMEKIRGKEISMIFQDPMTSLNPIMTIGNQVADMYCHHNKASKKEGMERAIELFRKVGIEPAEKRAKQYPFELSGGLQQRVMIAMAIACSPKLLIADEPTTALDVTIQAQILELLKELSKDLGMSILLITHNFGVVAQTCDRVSVMYAGKIVETGVTKEILKSAKHPYSKALIASIPGENEKKERLETIPGSPPALFQPPKACMFAPRCKYASEKCKKAYPPLMDCGDGHLVACFTPLNSEVNANV